MTKKNTATAKTVKTNEPTAQDKIAALKSDYERAVKAARSLKKRAKKGDVTNFVTGRPVNRDEKQVAALKVVAAVEGYPTNEWATRNQIAANGGKLKADAYGAPMFMPRGEGKFSYYLVYNKASVEWEGGKAPATFVKPTKKSAKKSTSKTKASASNADVKALKAENAALKAQLESIAETQASTAAVMAALVAKLGL